MAHRSIVWELAKKEIRLQQMTLAVGCLFVAGWAAVWLSGRFVPEVRSLPFDVLVLLYALVIALLAGSSASASERQLGTLQWQVLLPWAMWKQWTVKAGVALALALLLGLGLPSLLHSVEPWVADTRMDLWLVAPVMVMVVAVAGLGVYVSSVSETGVRALLLSLPVGVGLMLLTTLVIAPVISALHRMSPALHEGIAAVLPGGHVAQYRSVFRWLLLRQGYLEMSLTIAVVGLMLRLALVNHRSAERPAGRLTRHACAFGGALLCAALLSFAVSELARAVMLKAQFSRPGAAGGQSVVTPRPDRVHAPTKPAPDARR